MAEDFYNDTFFTDQNACTSPRLVVWMGSRIEEAKTVFWKLEHELAKKKYTFQSIQAVNKLSTGFLAAASLPGLRIIDHEDNLLIRVNLSNLTDNLMDYRESGGYFYEYDCKNIIELASICDDKHCQTIAYIGNKDTFLPLLQAGVGGIDRIVPIGKTMDFDLIWDGYQLPAYLTRTITLA